MYTYICVCVCACLLLPQLVVGKKVLHKNFKTTVCPNMSLNFRLMLPSRLKKLKPRY